MHSVVENKLLTYVFSCLIKLEKLLCLKYLGRSTLENSGGFHTMKLVLLWLQDTIESVDGSSTISYVLARKGATELELHGASSITVTLSHSDRCPKLSRRNQLKGPLNVQCLLELSPNIKWTIFSFHINSNTILSFRIKTKNIGNRKQS